MFAPIVSIGFKYKRILLAEVFKGDAVCTVCKLAARLSIAIRGAIIPGSLQATNVLNGL